MDLLLFCSEDYQIPSLLGGSSPEPFHLLWPHGHDASAAVQVFSIESFKLLLPIVAQVAPNNTEWGLDNWSLGAWPVAANLQPKLKD